MRHARNQVVFKTPFGWAGVEASTRGVSRIILPKKEKKTVEAEMLRGKGPCSCQRLAGLRQNTPDIFDPAILKKAVMLLQSYFTGERISFDIPVDTRYYTPFQQAVWRATASIPYGETRSYGWVAKEIGNPKSMRAVGQALGANPVPVIIPCHRVLRSSGALGGFGSGLPMKRKLLALELPESDANRRQ